LEKEDRVSLTTRFFQRHTSETDLFKEDQVRKGVVQRANRPITPEDTSKGGKRSLQSKGLVKGRANSVRKSLKFFLFLGWEIQSYQVRINQSLKCVFGRNESLD